MTDTFYTDLYPIFTTAVDDGVTTTIAFAVPAGSGATDISVVNATYIDDGGTCTVLDPTTGAVKEVLSGFGKSGNTLTSASRKYDTAALAVGDLVYVGMDSVRKARELAFMSHLAGHIEHTTNPATGSGKAAPIGYTCEDTSTGMMYFKTGSGDTDWQAL